MHINEFHTQDCPQSWSLLFLLFAHQLPEIIMKILNQYSSLLFKRKTIFSLQYDISFVSFVTFYHIHCITLTIGPGWPISPLSPFSPVSPGSPLSPLSPFEPCENSGGLPGQDIKSLTIHCT